MRQDHVLECRRRFPADFLRSAYLEGQTDRPAGARWRHGIPAAGASALARRPDNVTYSLEMSGRIGRREAAARAGALLELVDLADFARSFPHQLSGGMQQRVNLARALAVEPELLLLDEPFASVDAQTREALQVELLAICRRAEVTALFVAHDIGEAVFLADRVCVFSRRPGRIVREVRVHLPEPRILRVPSGNGR
jgi:NitT/TauT family transport system ATP-binding protein